MSTHILDQTSKEGGVICLNFDTTLKPRRKSKTSLFGEVRQECVQLSSTENVRGILQPQSGLFIEKEFAQILDSCIQRNMPESISLADRSINACAWDEQVIEHLSPSELFGAPELCAFLAHRFMDVQKSRDCIQFSKDSYTLMYLTNGVVSIHWNKYYNEWDIALWHLNEVQWSPGIHVITIVADQ